MGCTNHPFWLLPCCFASVAPSALTLVAPLPTITESLRIVGPGLGFSILGRDDVRIFTIEIPTLGIDDDVEIENLIMGLGNASSMGGAISAHNADLALRDLEISFCTVDSGPGGAVHLEDGNLQIYDSTFFLNAASGPGISEGLGGAVFVRDGGIVRIHGSLFSTNESQREGGAIYVTSADLIEIDRTTFTNNESQSNRGGAVAASATMMEVRRSHFAINKAQGSQAAGGGLGVTSTPDLLLEDSTFEGNRAIFDGGLSINDTAAVGRNLTFDGNLLLSVNGVGQAISVLFSSLEFERATITTHLADQPVINITSGGSSVNFANSILYNPSASEECLGSGFSTTGFNIFEDTTCGNAPDDMIGTDPLLEALNDNGGPVPTRFPTSNSPAIDTGSDHDGGGSGPLCLPTDARGISRPRDGDGNGSAICDRGAAEAYPSEIFADDFESGSISNWI